MSRDDDNQTEIIVAAAALVVSVIAFAATFLQCLQQYFASARGYAQCNNKVMGEWANTRKRRFNWRELRFEVEFDAPVIFVCPPKNQRKPVDDAPMYKLNGTAKSLKETATTTNLSLREDYKNRTPKQRLHTADNERASWSMLLSAIQRMESESRSWHESAFEYDADKPPTMIFARHDLPVKPPTLEDSHTLVVALQRKRKSWITMPAAVSKPYATTTMCHLVEMMAALGIYWKEFDRMYDRYRAEGNGFEVLGHRINDLGLIFSFQVNGISQFGQNRVIPVDEIKELCFGWVPTIYRSRLDQQRLTVPIDLMDLSSLQMGSKREIAETLMTIGCNNNAVGSYLEEGSRTSHLFPVSFEILGMLSQTLHIKHTYFTFIPNPTPDIWDSRSVSLVNMMESFGRHFLVDLQDTPRNPKIVRRISEHITTILGHLGDNNVQTLLRFAALHDALEDADEILTARLRTSHSPAEDMSVCEEAEDDGDKHGFDFTRQITAAFGKQFSGVEMSKLKASGRPSSSSKKPSAGLEKETPEQRHRRETVQDVLRSHIQEVLRVLNERQELSNDVSLPVPERWRPSRPRSRSLSPEPLRFIDTVSIDDVDSSGPDFRQEVLMELYCKRIRPSVVQSTARAIDRRASLHSPTSRRQSVASCDSPISPTKNATPAAAPVATSKGGKESTAACDTASPENPNTQGQPDADDTKVARDTLATVAASHDDIWCTLVFRMMCWLMLHDFNKLDIQVSKSELLGSRMPVFVA